MQPKKRLPLYTLYAMSLVSVTGDAMAAVAIPWFVLQTTGSAAQAGIAAFFGVAPIIIGTFFGGTVVDRNGYKRSSVIADLASGLTMLLIPLFVHNRWPVLLAVVAASLSRQSHGRPWTKCPTVDVTRTS